MSYQIDTIAVNTRVDWEHLRRPSQPQGRREEQFPGIPERFGVMGLTLPPDILVRGFLDSEGADTSTVYADLHNQIDVYERMQGDGAVHKVTIHGVVFDDCILVAFNTLRRSEPAHTGAEGASPVRVRWAVQFLWRQLKRSA